MGRVQMGRVQMGRVQMGRVRVRGTSDQGVGGLEGVKGGKRGDYQVRVMRVMYVWGGLLCNMRYRKFTSPTCAGVVAVAGRP